MAKPGRNDPCPCGSGKKFKKCCLEIFEAERAESLASEVEVGFEPGSSDIGDLHHLPSIFGSVSEPEADVEPRFCLARMDVECRDDEEAAAVAAEDLDRIFSRAGKHADPEQISVALAEAGYVVVEDFYDMDLEEIDEDDDLDLGPDEGGYDPMIAPDPGEWLATDESERIEAIRDYHVREGFDLPNAHVHAVIHCIVENQVALGDEVPMRATIDRLMGEGLDRHDAVHAAGTVLARSLFHLLTQETAPEDKSSVRDYSTELENLTAKSWLESMEE